MFSLRWPEALPTKLGRYGSQQNMMWFICPFIWWTRDQIFPTYDLSFGGRVRSWPQSFRNMHAGTEEAPVWVCRQKGHGGGILIGSDLLSGTFLVCHQINWILWRWKFELKPLVQKVYFSFFGNSKYLTPIDVKLHANSFTYSVYIGMYVCIHSVNIHRLNSTTFLLLNFTV